MYLNNVRVRVVGTNREAFTNEAGEYHLDNLPSGSVTLDVYYTGSAPQQATVSVETAKDAEQNFIMRSSSQTAGADDAITLSEFTVTSTREINAAALAFIKGDETFAINIVEDVLEICQQLQNQTPVSYWVDFTTGEAYLGLGEIDKALAEYAKGLHRNPAPGPRELRSALGGISRMVEAKKLPNDVIDNFVDAIKTLFNYYGIGITFFGNHLFESIHTF